MKYSAHRKKTLPKLRWHFGKRCSSWKMNHFPGAFRAFANIFFIKNEEQPGYAHFLIRIPGIYGITKAVYKSKVFGFTAIGQIPGKSNAGKAFREDML